MIRQKRLQQTTSESAAYREISIESCAMKRAGAKLLYLPLRQSQSNRAGLQQIQVAFMQGR
jgi:hypothetical protein